MMTYSPATSATKRPSSVIRPDGAWPRLWSTVRAWNEYWIGIPSTSLPSASSARAFMCTTSPVRALSTCGFISMCTVGFSSTRIGTLIEAASAVAVIVASPGVSKLMRPSVVTSATAVLLLSNVTTTSLRSAPERSVSTTPGRKFVPV